MLLRYFKTALRSFSRDRIFSIINLLGLAIGMAAFLLIINYVRFELSYERFLEQPEDVYRVYLNRYLNDELLLSSAENFPGAGLTMKEEFPEVISFARLYNLGYKNNVIITSENGEDYPVKIKQRRFLYADSSFLSLMGYPILMGDGISGLSKPNQAVITESMAKRYFGDSNPIGKLLRMQDDDRNNELCEVTAVIKDLPQSTHLKFDVLFSYATLLARAERTFERYQSSWARNDMYTYVRLAPGQSAEALEAKLPALVDKHSPNLAENNRRDELKLQAITDIHLKSDLAEEFEANSDQSTVYQLALIAAFILAIAWINYINLATARAVNRAKEVGVRQVLGATKKQLISQFLSESALFNLIALTLALLILLGVMPLFNEVSSLNLMAEDFFTTSFALMLISLWLAGTLLSGIYPAFVLSSFKASTTLRGSFKYHAAGKGIRRFLVFFQFFTSVSLVAATLIIYLQVNHLLNQDIGMDTTQVLVIERPGVVPKEPGDLELHIDTFRNRVVQNPNIQGVSASFTIPGKKRVYKANIKKFGAPDDMAVTVRWNSMDYDFLEVFGMELIAGRTFSPEFASDDQGAMVLTESAIKKMGFTDASDAVNQQFTFVGSESPRKIIGVVNDYSQESLKLTQDPVMFFFTQYGGEFYSLRINTKQNLRETVSFVQDAWNEAFPGNPMEYYFLDDFFNRLYQNDQRFNSLFAMFAVLGIILACLGLFGLSAFTVKQKTKEISIRKVLGSTNSGLFGIISVDFARLIGLAIVLAIPVSVYFMKQWLNGYAVKVGIPVWVYFLSAGLVIAVAAITISFHLTRIIRINPARTLKQE